MDRENFLYSGKLNRGEFSTSFKTAGDRYTQNSSQVLKRSYFNSETTIHQQIKDTPLKLNLSIFLISMQIVAAGVKKQSSI